RGVGRHLDDRGGALRRRDLPDPRGRAGQPVDELQQGDLSRGQAGARRGGAGRAAVPAAGVLRRARRHAQPGVQRGQPAAGMADAGRPSLLPDDRGLVMVDPERMHKNRVPPPVVLEQVRANGEPVAPPASLDFPPDRESFEFHYTALGLSVPERLRFRYKLEELDRDWVDAGTRRVAYYTRIPPGRYRFVVTAANEDGVWNETGASVRF